MRTSVVLTLLVMGCFFTSCDDRYDLNKGKSSKVELFSDGLSLPIGYTGQLKLDSLINEGNYLLVDPEGNYYLSLQDTLGMVLPSIDSNLLKIEGRAYSGSVNLSISPSSGRRLMKHTPSKSGIVVELQKLDTVKIDLESTITEEVVAIRKAVLRKPAPITISVHLENVPASFQTTPFDLTFEAQLPDEFKLNSARKSTFTLSGSIINQQELTESKYFTEFDFNDLSVKNGIFKYKDEIPFLVSLRIPYPGAILDPADLIAFENMNVIYDVKIGNVIIQTVTGKINAVLDPQQTETDLTGFSDFFNKSPDNKLDLLKAHISFDVKTPFPFNPTLNITPTKSNVDLATESVTLQLTEQKTNYIFLSNTPSDAPSGYQGVQMNTVGIINSIPDHLKLEWAGRTDSSRFITVDLFKKYTVEGAYQVNVPMSFGDQFRLTFYDTIKMPGNSEDIESFVENGTVALSGEIISTFPLALTVDLQGLDSSNAPVSQMNFVVSSLSEFLVEMSPSQVKQLKHVAKWVVGFKALPISGKQAIISKNQYFQLQKLVLKKTGSVIINDASLF